MVSIAAGLAQWLPAGEVVGVLMGPGVIWLVHRIICVIELWMILRSLPSADRVTAAVAYVTTRSARIRGETGWTTAWSPCQGSADGEGRGTG
jgi:hypothetical protein